MTDPKDKFFKDLSETEAFKRRNKEWPCEKWDYTEWEECIEEAKREGSP